MALMTPEERTKLVPKGLYVKFKCDGCGKPIMSPLTFTGPNGEDFCSRACLGGSITTEREKESKMVKEDTDKPSKSSKPKPSKNKAAVGPSKNKAVSSKKKKHREEEEEEEVETPKKKKRVVEEEEEEAPKKKKAKKAADDDEEEAPKPSGKNPYTRKGSVVYDVFELAKKGTTVKAINALLKERDCGPTRVWRELRSGEFRGTKWRYTETDDGKVTVKIRVAKSE